MKRIFLSLALLAGVCSLAGAQSMKMVVDSKGEVVGRYVKTNANSYTVMVQDDYDVPKSGNKVVTFSAENGQGVIWQKNEGTINVRSIPSTSGAIVCKITYDPGDGVPMTYDCLGKENGWYKINVDGKMGYVRQDLVEWDGMDTF